MSLDANATAEDSAMLAELTERLKNAITSDQELGTVGPLRAFALIDAPKVAGIAIRGLAARLHLGGLSIRAQAVRELHGTDQLDPGQIVCGHCSVMTLGPVLWPCPTLQALDGLDAP